MAIPAAPVIKVVGSLLGGLFGRKSEKKAAAAQREYDKPVNVRARYEEAGINPLLAFQGGVVGQSQPVASQNYMGAAIADASMIIADEMSKRKEAQQLSQLQSMNARLQEKVQNLTLRPKVGGIYAGREQTPTMRQALGYGGSYDAQGGGGPAGSSGGGSPAGGAGGGVDSVLPGVETLTPDRESDRTKTPNVPGLFQMDNWFTGGPIWMYGQDADETEDLFLQSPIVVPQIASNWAHRANRP